MSLAVKALESGVLDPQFHDQLVKDLASVAKTANVPPQAIWTSMTEACTQEEIEYVRDLGKHAEAGKYGLVYVGSGPKVSSEVLTRMMLCTGACLRNYVNAKLLTLHAIIERLRTDSMPKPTVLLVPNFYITMHDGGKIADWQIAGLLGMLYQRQAEGLQTFLYVQDMKGLATEYGTNFVEHLTKNFKFVSA